MYKMFTLNEGTHEMPDLVIKIEPFDPILMITHFVRTPLLSNSFPAAIGLSNPVIDSAWHKTT